MLRRCLLYDEKREETRRYLNGPWGLVLDGLLKRHYEIQDEIKRLESPFMARGLSSMIKAKERISELCREDKKVLSDFQVLKDKHKYYY